ncbi:RagB/SusD family nutrient uptake outer membrane protein [Chitinophaga sedimenti]|nr:RagB/SusD family nutrient uptake outer membrane protein [Chitinophaga sedimenti]MCK7557717.1 RagB/SusD family nutrient uptake outer membrane protein [Chitinophaga sedimenti]
MNKIKTNLLTFVLIASLSSCVEFLEVPTPSHLTLSEDVFSSEQAVNAAALHMYTSMLGSASIQYVSSLYPALSADEFNHSSTTTEAVEMYKNALTPNNPAIQPIWQNAYKIIYEANNLIEGLSTSTHISEAIKKQLIGESLFVRAYWHLNLTNLFGDIPIITTTDYLINNVKKRDSVKKFTIK